MFDRLESAIEAAHEARQAILTIEATTENRKLLDTSFNALGDAIKALSALLGDPENSE